MRFAEANAFPNDFLRSSSGRLRKSRRRSSSSVVAKRADSPYRAGRRSFDWIKIKTSVGRAIDEERAKWNERPATSGQRRDGR
jgi:ATP-dependent DNA ligase